jgi:hypothetical protein
MRLAEIGGLESLRKPPARPISRLPVEDRRVPKGSGLKHLAAVQILCAGYSPMQAAYALPTCSRRAPPNSAEVQESRRKVVGA